MESQRQLPTQVQQKLNYAQRQSEEWELGKSLGAAQSQEWSSFCSRPLHEQINVLNGEQVAPCDLSQLPPALLQKRFANALDELHFNPSQHEGQIGFVTRLDAQREKVFNEEYPPRTLGNTKFIQLLSYVPQQETTMIVESIGSTHVRAQGGVDR